MSKKYIIYKRTNLINNMIYIGLTSQEPEKRWHTEDISNQEIGKAVREFGKENFKNEIIDEAETEEEIKEKERYWIKYYDSNNKLKGYNRTKGGNAGGKTNHGKMYIDINNKIIFNYQKDLIEYLDKKAKYLHYFNALNYDNIDSPIWGILTIKDYDNLIKDNKIKRIPSEELTIYIPKKGQK